MKCCYFVSSTNEEFSNTRDAVATYKIVLLANQRHLLVRMVGVNLIPAVDSSVLCPMSPKASVGMQSEGFNKQGHISVLRHIYFLPTYSLHTHTLL